MSSRQGASADLPVPAAVVLAAHRIAFEILSEEPAVRVILFGSRATGRFEERSDIDLAVDAGRPLEPGIIEAIRETFEAVPILQRVDVSDLARLAPQVRDAALREGKVLVEREAA